MKINIVTGKPADGGPARCLKISEQADEVIDFFTTLRTNKGVLEKTGEKFVNIALFQRPTTTKRSSFPENAAAAGQPQTSAVPGPSGTGAKGDKQKAALADSASSSAARESADSSQEETGI